MITSPDNPTLKQIRKLSGKRERARTQLFVAEGEDLIDAAAAAGWAPETLLRSGEDVQAELLAQVSSLGSGSRVLAIYRQRWSQPSGDLSVYLHGVGDPGNIGTILRAAHGLCDGPVVLGPDCADPYSPKAVRAGMGSLFARPPVKARLGALPGTKVALDGSAEDSLADIATATEIPIVLCVGAERAGLPAEILEEADVRARISMRGDGPESLNVAMAASIGLYELGNRMAGDG